MERLEEVLGVLVLPRQLYSQVNEARRFNQLDETAQSDELWRVHLDLGEAGDQAVGELVVAGEEAEGEGADGVRRPCLE